MRAAVSIGLALALAAVAVSARVPQLFPAPWNPELTSAQRERVEHYKPRFPHTPTPPNNPCRAVCAATDSAAASEECITCCRTARHHIPWNCAAERGAHGDLHPLPDAHNGVPNKCCTEWSSECWDRPSADNYEHSCDMCVGPTRQYNPSLTGCDSNYMTSACWVGGGPPRDGGYEIVQITGPIYVPGNYRTDLTVNITNYWYVNGGANVTLAPGAVVGIYNLQFQDPQTQPHLVTALGTGLQLAAWYTTFSGTGRPFVVAAPRAATFDFGNFDFSMGNLHVDNSYIPNVIGSVPPPAGPAAPQVRYLSPRYRSTILMYYDGNTDANSHFEVIGDSGEVTIAFSNSHNLASNADQPRPFRGSLLVDGTYGAKLLLTGQAAGWYQSAYNNQIYTTFTGGALGNTFAVTLANGAALSFSKYTQLDYLSTTVTGTAPVFVEFLPGANATDGVNLSGLNSAPTGSAVILDGAVTLGTAVNLGTANRFTCAAGCYSGTKPQGGVCLPAVSTCTGTSCAGACSCTPTTATLFASTYANGSMCSFAACSSACLGGSLCAGANTCTANCPATTTAHFSANCQAQDGTCATACTGGLQCSAGGTCASGDSSSTGYNSGDATARAKLSPVTVAVVAVAAALMLR